MVIGVEIENWWSASWSRWMIFRLLNSFRLLINIYALYNCVQYIIWIQWFRKKRLQIGIGELWPKTNQFQFIVFQMIHPFYFCQFNFIKRFIQMLENESKQFKQWLWAVHVSFLMRNRFTFITWCNKHKWKILNYPQSSVFYLLLRWKCKFLFQTLPYSIWLIWQKRDWIPSYYTSTAEQACIVLIWIIFQFHSWFACVCW